VTELAGFDVIAEAHLDTIIDLVNYVMPFTNPLDGKVIYPFGGPVMTDLNVDLGSSGVVTMRGILEAKLEPIVHQPLARLPITVTGGSMVLGAARSTILAGREAFSCRSASPSFPRHNRSAPTGPCPSCALTRRAPA
jgi:hypothetical protein